jgi:hypothetical protein
MSSFNNVALFIKRAEEFQTEEFIVDAFRNNNIGKVREVTFIKKNNDTGKKYNGVIVIFERWNINNLVETLINEMSASPDGTTRFYFDQSHYWIINIHKQKMIQCEETTLVDPSLSDKEKIAQLEEMVRSMSAQIHYNQKHQEKLDNKIADLEQKETHHHLVNMEIRAQLEDVEDKFSRLETNVERMATRLELSNKQVDKLYDIIEEMEQDISDKNSIISYMEQQVQDMKTMLLGVLDTDPIKQSINDYIKYYLS